MKKLIVLLFVLILGIGCKKEGSYDDTRRTNIEIKSGETRNVDIAYVETGNFYIVGKYVSNGTYYWKVKDIYSPTVIKSVVIVSPPKEVYNNYTFEQRIPNHIIIRFRII